MEERDNEMLEFMITAILADYDMMTLINKYKRPYDEYGPEARTILRYIELKDYDVPVDILAGKIQYIFNIWFNKAPDIIPCIKIAHEIKLML